MRVSPSLVLILAMCRKNFAISSFNVTRVFNNGDIFNFGAPPSVDEPQQTGCDPRQCSIYLALPFKSSACFCQCPSDYPVFLQHIKQCSNTTDDCYVVPFYGRSKRQGNIPTVFLPLKGQLINPNGRLDWQSVIMSDKFKRTQEYDYISCSISSVGYLSKENWIAIDNGAILFALVNENGYTGVQWMGDKKDQLQLTGKLIQLSLECSGNLQPSLCIVFRVVGKDVDNFGLLGANLVARDDSGQSEHKDGGSANADRANQVGLIVGVACGLMLALTLMSLAIFWTVCWRQQKERLARKIQLHVLNQQRLQQNGGMLPNFGPRFDPSQEEAVRSAIEMLNSYGTQSHYNPFLEPTNWRQGSSPISPYRSLSLPDQRDLPDGAYGLPPPPPYPQSPGRRRLHFSPEYFDLALMAHPPPSAELFLFELRRMIEAARHRIKNRRYSPQLEQIPEEDQQSPSQLWVNYQDKIENAVLSDEGRIRLDSIRSRRRKIGMLLPTMEHHRSEVKCKTHEMTEQTTDDTSPVHSEDSGLGDESAEQQNQTNKIIQWLMAATIPDGINVLESDGRDGPAATATLPNFVGTNTTADTSDHLSALGASPASIYDRCRYAFRRALSAPENRISVPSVFDAPISDRVTPTTGGRSIENLLSRDLPNNKDIDSALRNNDRRPAMQRHQKAHEISNGAAPATLDTTENRSLQPQAKHSWPRPADNNVIADQHVKRLNALSPALSRAQQRLKLHYHSPYVSSLRREHRRIMTQNNA